jgi:hypothetical protein
MLNDRKTAALEKRTADLRKRHSAELRPLTEEHRRMKDQHRQQRQELARRQADRQRREELARAERLRKGVMGLWDRLTGKRGKISEINAREAAAGRGRDRDERQALIDEQMIGRGALQARFVQLRDRHRADRHYHRAELSMMMAMMKDDVRDTFRDHAQEIEGRKDRPERDRDEGHDIDFHEPGRGGGPQRGGRGRSRNDREGAPKPRSWRRAAVMCREKAPQRSRRFWPHGRPHGLAARLP